MSFVNFTPTAVSIYGDNGHFSICVPPSGYVACIQRSPYTFERIGILSIPVLDRGLDRLRFKNLADDSECTQEQHRAAVALMTANKRAIFVPEVAENCKRFMGFEDVDVYMASSWMSATSTIGPVTGIIKIEASLYAMFFTTLLYSLYTKYW
jgi:hypothetical protein